MLRNEIVDLVTSAVRALAASGELPDLSAVPVEISDTKSPDHGDYACNFALIASKQAGMPPRAIAEKLQPELLKQDIFEAIDVAGPGFLNFRLKSESIAAYVSKVLELGDSLPRTPNPNPRRINVEFVSVNPNGPITVGSARGAAFGDLLSRVFEASGDKVEREYYINDGVNSQQMKLFAESVRHYYREGVGLPTEFPEKGYRGEYVAEVAADVKRLYGDTKAEADVAWFQQVAQDLMIERQRQDLAQFDVKFDRWFSEQALHNEGKVESALVKLEANGAAYRAYKPADAEEDPEDELAKEESAFPQDQSREALWLRSTAFGDDKDRVLVRGDGRPAYIAADLAYLENKLGERNYDKAYLILGPDHHGYIGRMYAACQALGYDLDRFEIIIFQIVRFVKDGKPAPMRKRDGNIYELRDLIDELGAAAAPNASKEEQQRIGVDVSRFFYLMRSHDTHMDFDIDLATKQSDENPVFYVQYAHARICSVLRKAAEAGIADPNPQHRNTATPQHRLLAHPKELALIKKILDLPYEARRCATDYGVHRLTTYAIELSRTYHHFYDACRVIQADQPELSQARLALCEAARVALRSTLTLLGVSAPERMERESQELTPV